MEITNKEKIILLGALSVMTKDEYGNDITDDYPYSKEIKELKKKLSFN